MAGPEGSAPPLDAQDMKLMEDHLAREAADAARSKLEMDAVTSSYGAIEAARDKGTEINIPGFGEFGGTQSAERTGLRTLKVVEHNASIPSAPEGGTLFDDPSPRDGGGRDRIETTTTESSVPVRGLGVLGKPKMEAAEPIRKSTITSKTGRLASDITRERTKDGEPVYGEDTSVEEVTHGSRRIVTRKVTTGPDKEGGTVIKVEQSSTDLAGENPRSRTWKHTADEPSMRGRQNGGGEIEDAVTGETKRKVGDINQAKVARDTAKVISRRVVSAQKGMEHRRKAVDPEAPVALPVNEAAVKAADDRKAVIDSYGSNSDRFL